jgi:UDP-N-acetylglucosamine 2-epimerase (non-hydrolysing)
LLRYYRRAVRSLAERWRLLARRFRRFAAATRQNTESAETEPMTENGDGGSEPREVVVVVGTRPEIVKTAPVLRALRAADGLEPYLVHTGQHYDAKLSATFFETFDVPTPDANLGVESGSHGEQTAAGLAAIEDVVTERDPAMVLAQGDTNAVLSAALAVGKLPIPFGHVEAGLRSGDDSMPEEQNRRLADHLADLAFAPTETAAANLADEAITDGVYVTGNTVVDACRTHVPLAERDSTVLERLGVDPGGYVAATIHRERNTDDPDRLRRIVAELDGADAPVVLPAHPRTADAVAAIDCEPTGSLRLVEPLDYHDFVKLLGNARAVVTDSGGVQEEASVVEVPCLTVRPNTERPETVRAGVNELVEPAALGEWVSKLVGDDDLHRSMRGRPELYGDGDAGRRIVEVVDEWL